MPNLGPTELLLILLIALLLFGAGRVARIGGEMGTAIREFRKGVRGDDEEKATDNKQIDSTTQS